MKVYLQTLGCKLNESELESWARDFAARGDEIVSDPRAADTIIFNTCTVTAQAARKSRNLSRHLARENANAQIVLTGCYATMSSEQARSLPNVAFVVPNADKDALVNLTRERLGDFPYASPFSGFSENRLVKTAGLRTRAFVKIQDGCNMSCTYCIIPLARGRARSRPQNEIIDEIKSLVHNGYHEVILTGVQISDYRLEERDGESSRQRALLNGRDDSPQGRGRLRGLCDLVDEILRETNLPRLRLTSIAPWDLDSELLGMFSDARLCRHLHLSLQSGSTTVLRRMRRPYTADQFAEVVGMARAKVPDVALTTDVIVGFPGEADVEFQESIEFVERMNFARVHVFPYSAREGTIAAKFPLHVSDLVKDARTKAMQRVADASQQKFAQQSIGRTFNVLYEEQTNDAGIWTGYTDNYIRVVTRSHKNLSNQIVATRLAELVDDGVRGEI